MVIWQKSYTKQDKKIYYNFKHNTRLNEAVISHGKPFNIRKATTDHWYDVALGTSDAHIAINLVNKESSIVVELYINDNKALFDSLYEAKDKIEEALEFELDWQRLEGKKASRIKHNIKGLNFGDHSNYPMLMDETIKKVIIMKKVFKEYI